MRFSWKTESPTVYKSNSFTVKLLLYLSTFVTFGHIQYMSGGIWEAIIENPGLSVEIMEWDVCIEAKAAQINASLRRFTEQNQTARTNGKASISLSFWDGQHGLLMWMGLAVKKLSDSCIHTLLPSKGSSFSSESEERKKTEICVSATCASVDVTFYFCSWKTSNLLSKPHKNQTSREWGSANSLESIVKWINIFPEWLCLTAAYFSPSNCADMSFSPSTSLQPVVLRTDGDAAAVGTWRRSTANCPVQK